MRVEVTARSEGGGVFTIADDGPGFAENNGERVPADRGVSGSSTGLGLDIARRTAEASGGSMRIGLVLRTPDSTPRLPPLISAPGSPTSESETTLEIPSGGALITLIFGGPTITSP
jgi:hypothetical protein